MDTTERKDVRDDNETGVTDRYRRSSNHSASATAGELRSSLPSKAHPWHLATLGSTLLLALLLLLSGCSQASSPPAGTPTPTPQAVATPTPTPILMPSPTPTPKPPPLGLVPQDCPTGPTPRPVFSDVGPGVGSFPVWAFGFGGPHAIVRIPTSYFTYTQ